MMLLKVAWKNIWRNKVRSFVVITALALGLWAGVFAGAFVKGMMQSKVKALVHTEISHMQIHEPGFRDEYQGTYVIENNDAVIQSLQQDERVEAVSERLISMGMLQSARKTSALRLVGVNPELEKKVSNLHEMLVEGSYFESKVKRPIVLSQKTAEEYDIKMGSKVVFTMQDIHGDMKSAVYKVVGIYKTSNNMYDKMTAFVPFELMQKMYDLDQGSHEIAVWLGDHENAEPVAADYSEKFKELEVLPWLDLSLGLRMMTSAIDIYLYVIVGIILAALLFVVLNTMLMAVLERTREIGMLMAIGMDKARVFRMIMYETIFMSMVGVPIGLFISWLSVTVFGQTGIDLSAAEYENLGYASIIYPRMDFQSYVVVAIMVLVMAFVASLYPAIKALRLKPVEAIRKV